jgi:excisionase family DNA binding protein
MEEHSDILTEKQAAKYLGLSPRTLQERRRQGMKPPYFKIGRSVRYKLKDLKDFLAQHRVNNER